MSDWFTADFVIITRYLSLPSYDFCKIAFETSQLDFELKRVSKVYERALFASDVTA